MLIYCFIVIGDNGGLVHSFGNDGHRVIAEIASNLVSPKSTLLLDKYFGGWSLSDVCVIPDEYNHHPEGKWTYTYHFVDYFRDDKPFEWSHCDSAGCAVSAIFNYTKLQAADTVPTICRAAVNTSYLIEPCSLIFLTHFVGDIHQPLHCAYKDDRGGNFVKVEFFGKQMTLHKVWDSALLKYHMNITGSDWQMFATKLVKELTPAQIIAYGSEINPIVWANESFNITRDDVYNFGGDTLSLPYYKANIGLLTQRLVMAGVRLAHLIDYVFTKQQL